MTDALIERLNALAIDCENTDGWEEAAATCDEAVQALKAKDAEIEQWSAWAEGLTPAEISAGHKRHIAQKDAEIAELREALKPFAEIADTPACKSLGNYDNVRIYFNAERFRAARKALGGSDVE